MDWVDLTSEKERDVSVIQESYRKIQVRRKDALERYDLVLQKINEAKQADEGAD
jgi:hypothetical protein